MKILAKILKAIVIAVLAVVAILAVIIVYAEITDYRPREKTPVEANENVGQLGDSATLTLLTWNLGYAGLDSKMDFFYDGGKKVFTPKLQCLKNLAGIMEFLKKNDSIDFILLQEVDRKSRRSYKLDEYATITAHEKYASSTFATNYKVFFVPVPFSSPMGSVNSGIATLSRYLPSSVVRYSFPGEYGFPKQLFMLDRCFMVSRYPVRNGKELVLINTHNEAFDPGQIRKAQMEYLKKFLLAEYEKGNYIIAGGDWNQCPPLFTPEFAKYQVNTTQMVIPADYLPPDWHWLFDNKTPSNRSVIAAYDPATTTTTVIDFFLLSPNIRSISVNCVDLGFANTDHNPVRVSVRLK
ncbi:MAG TPA: endonuclease/exonuclease/phosphatase family protein [Bacteroidales bacterium]|nr:endonuclease/exonuclease/phosphatase family protein [Bacteroidales bacterium]